MQIPGAPIWMTVVACLLCAAAGGAVDGLLGQARTALRNGHVDEALALADKVITADPQDPRGYVLRGGIHDAARRYEQAVSDYDKAIELQPGGVDLHQRRGAAHFKLGHIEAAIRDFDRVIALEPHREPHHWQRGIAYYYVGRYEDGRRQFDVHQTVNPNDVENAVWRYLCMARTVGVGKARAELLPIRGDRRVPMMKIHALFAGRVTPEDVLAACQAHRPSKAQLDQRLFYAHLYIGLYHEAAGDREAARKHITRAAEAYRVGHYMWEVARVHADRLRPAAGEGGNHPTHPVAPQQGADAGQASSPTVDPS